jgi:hypothetical protein
MATALRNSGPDRRPAGTHSSGRSTWAWASRSYSDHRWKRPAHSLATCLLLPGGQAGVLTFHSFAHALQR